MSAAPDPRDIMSTRRFPAAPAQVFAAYADPRRLARWWGPKDFRNTFRAFDFRPGGEWEFTMHGPDGRDYANHSRFEAVEPARHIVIRHLSAPGFTMDVTLAPEDGGTRMTWRQRFDTAALREQLAAICIPANEQNFDRLEAELARDTVKEP
jgi:uncharacterized protein YndB with AHSA1/START domain